ncbi:protein vac14 homolog [Plakobranchus ocellatus]|uniref:Protein vac14 homolog n=1 Tax=Plakobranchus ocellatus TaxID=259542 RepID=A0AAV4DXQ3_9GAST|nr:protein vac14 homolog [Plakobranchus ocellatus]
MQIVKDLISANQFDQIKKLLKALEEFASSQNPNTRKGGLIGLAAVAIGLGKDSISYIASLVPPVVLCFHDGDSRVQYYACESLYNIVKVARGAICLTSMKCLMYLAKIYTRNPFARQFVVSWIEVFDAVPDINMLVLLPEILDGLFQILGDNSNEIRKMCQNVLAEFLEDDLIQFTAISWLREFILLAGRSMLPHVAGILNAVLPCLSYSDEGRKRVREAAERLNQALRKLVEAQDDQPTPTVENISSQTHTDSSSPTAPEADAAKNSSATIQLDIPSVIKVLQRLLGHETIQMRVAALKWFNLLLVKTPNKTFRHIDDFFDLLMTTLADPSDDTWRCFLKSHPILLDLDCQTIKLFIQCDAPKSQKGNCQSICQLKPSSAVWQRF